MAVYAIAQTARSGERERQAEQEKRQQLGKQRQLEHKRGKNLGLDLE